MGHVAHGATAGTHRAINPGQGRPADAHGASADRCGGALNIAQTARQDVLNLGAGGGATRYRQVKGIGHRSSQGRAQTRCSLRETDDWRGCVRDREGVSGRPCIRGRKGVGRSESVGGRVGNCERVG